MFKRFILTLPAMDSHSASCQLPGLSVKSNETAVKRSLLPGSSLTEKREDSSDKENVTPLMCSRLSGDVTHTLAAIVEVCPMSDWEMVISAEKATYSSKGFYFGSS